MAINNTVQPLSSFLSPKKGLVSLGGTQTTTPTASVVKKNTPINVAYGAPSAIPTGKYTSNPSENLNFGVSNTPQTTAPTVAPTQQPNATAGIVPPPTNTMKTPSGIPITGNASTYAGVPQNAQQNNTQQPVKGLFPSVASSLATFDPFKNPVVSDAYSKAQELNKALAESKRNEAGGTATLLRQAIPLGDQEGQARVLQDQYLKQQDALASELQGQASLYGAGFTGTGQQQSALSSVGNLSPEATRFETFGGGGLAPEQRASELAQQVKSGLISPQAAESQMNSLYGGAGATFLNQALQGGGFNYNTATAQSAAQQSNVQQQGTAQTDIARSGLAKATEDYAQMTGAAQFAGQQSNAVTSILAQAGLNNVSSTDYNKALNNLKSRFGDTNFAALNTALIEARSAYANLLSTGGQTPTGNESQALATLDISQPASAISASIQQLENAVARRLQAQNSIRTQYEQNLGGGGNTSNAGGEFTWDTL